MSLISDYTWTQLCAFSVQTYSTSITMAIYFHMAMWSVVCKLMSTPPATRATAAWLACSLSCSALHSSSLCHLGVQQHQPERTCQGGGQGEGP